MTNNIRKLRQLKGLTQQELADKLGLSKFNISDYEIGRTEPDIQTLKKFADFFEVSIDYILKNSNSKDIPIEPDIEMDDFQFALYGEVKDLTDEQKQDLMDMIKIIKRKN